MAYTAEVYFGTADRAELGFGHIVLKASPSFCAKFLDGGKSGVLAPSLVQQIGLGEHGHCNRVNSTTFDLHYVPVFEDKRYYMTYDPVLVLDWENNKDYASLIVTLGRMLGKAFGGGSQVYIKPQVLMGYERPVDWSFQIGCKVIGF